MRLPLLLFLLPACTSAAVDAPLVPEILPAAGRTYVIDSIEVGGTNAEASAIAVDLDGDDYVDNAFGTSLAVAESVLDVDLDAEITDALSRGELLHLLMFASDETGEHLDTGRLFLGADTDGDPGNNFTGNAELAIRADSKLDDAAFGQVSAHRVELAQGRLTVENVLFAPIRLPLREARIIGTFDELGRFSGTIAGGIDASDLDRLRLEVAGAIAGEGNQMCDPAEIPCCPEGSRGEVYMTYFDGDHDCQLDGSEVAGSDIFDWLLYPDLDLDGDDETDAMSASFHVTAVPARFEIP